MSLLDNISSYLKEDVNKEELAGALTGYIKPNELTKEDFKGLIKDSKDFASVFDSEVNTRRDTGVNNFMEKDLPKLLKEKEAAIRAELNPEETPEQKQVRELLEKVSAMESKEALSLYKDELSQKANELEFPAEIARKYANLGQGVEPLLSDFMEWHKSIVEPLSSAAAKAPFSKDQPKSSKITPADIDTKIMAARKAGDTHLALQLQLQKQNSA